MERSLKKKEHKHKEEIMLEKPKDEKPKEDEEEPGFTDNLMDKTSNIATYGLNKAVDYVLPNLDTASSEELQQELKEKASKLGEVITEVASDPEVHQLIESSGEAFAELTGELLDAVDEPIKEVAATSVDTASQIILSSGKTLGKTGVDLVMSVLGEVPFAGGIVDLLVTAGIAFNGIAKNIKIGTKNLFKIVEIGNELTGNVLEPVQEGLDEFTELSDKAKETYENIEERLGLLQDGFKGEGHSNAGSSDIRLKEPEGIPFEEEAKERLIQTESDKKDIDNRLTQSKPEPMPTPVKPMPIPVKPMPTPVSKPIPKPISQSPVKTSLVSVKEPPKPQPSTKPLPMSKPSLTSKPLAPPTKKAPPPPPPPLPKITSQSNKIKPVAPIRSQTLQEQAKKLKPVQAKQVQAKQVQAKQVQAQTKVAVPQAKQVQAQTKVEEPQAKQVQAKQPQVQKQSRPKSQKKKKTKKGKSRRKPRKR